MILYALLALILTTLSLAFVRQTAEMQDITANLKLPSRPLTLSDIFTALRTEAPLAKKNKILTEGVEARGITFVLTPEIEKELREAGANNALIEAIRKKSCENQQASNPQTTIFTYPEIIDALKGKLPVCFKDKAQFINFLITEVKKRKVDKSLTRETERDLRQAGADERLIQALRENSPPPCDNKNIFEKQTAPLTYAQLSGALNTKLPNECFRDKSQFINALIDEIKKYKIDKPLTAETEKNLRQAGAGDRLIQAVRENSPKTGQFVNSIGMEFVLIPSGSFLMGSPASEKDRFANEGPARRVTLKYEFYLGKFEVTQSQWKTLMGSLPAAMGDLDADFIGDNKPVVRVSWNDTQDFIARLNTQNDGFTYRLPSEAEWEYAARAGTRTRFYWGDDPGFTSTCRFANLKDSGECRDNFTRPAPVGTFSPNKFGLFDMTGNVWEWCQDIWQSTYENLPADGSANLAVGDSNKRVQRGGSWADTAKTSRNATRGFDSPTDRNDEDGFRLVAVPR